MSEIAAKLETVRSAMAEQDVAAVRLRGSDWYAWITAGASNVVLMAAETGVAEVFVTAEQAFVLTDVIEAPRLSAESVPDDFVVCSHAWQHAERRDAFVREHAGSGRVASDRPCGDEEALPSRMMRARLHLTAAEVDRYAALGAEAAAAMTATLVQAWPDWSEHELAATCARELMTRGIEPLLVQAGGEDRVARFRHLLPTGARLGSRAMLAVCARHCGLVASATRFVYFRTPTPTEQQHKHDLAAIEAAAFVTCRPGRTMSEIYAALARAYEEKGHDGEIDRHHQGGLAGYLAREVIAGPDVETALPACCAMAWNPSVTGAKIEDTIAGDADGVRILTVDPAWPTFPCGPHARPDYLIRP